MNLLEIALIIIGIIIIIISCRLVDRSQKAVNQPISLPFSYESSLTEEDKKQLMDKINDLLSEVTEDTIIRTDDTLSKISNEKILAVNEFSDQILEKIKRNHEEVVFLYNMLNDKEKELKAAVKEIDSSKKIVQNIIEGKVDDLNNQAVKPVRTQMSAKMQVQKTAPDKLPSEPKHESSNHPAINIMNTNNNTLILNLYSQGKTVVEISKLLGLGQGEVKLVIDLYKGKK